MMNKTELSRRIGISGRHLEYLLRGERNASVQVATKLQRVTGIAREIWVFGTPRQRQAAWKNFQNQHEQEGK